MNFTRMEGKLSAFFALMYDLQTSRYDGDSRETQPDSVLFSYELLHI